MEGVKEELSIEPANSRGTVPVTTTDGCWGGHTPGEEGGCTQLHKGRPRREYLTHSGRANAWVGGSRCNFRTTIPTRGIPYAFHRKLHVGLPPTQHHITKQDALQGKHLPGGAREEKGLPRGGGGGSCSGRERLAPLTPGVCQGREVSTTKHCSYIGTRERKSKEGGGLGSTLENHEGSVHVRKAA